MSYPFSEDLKEEILQIIPATGWRMVRKGVSDEAEEGVWIEEAPVAMFALVRIQPWHEGRDDELERDPDPDLKVLRPITAEGWDGCSA